MDERELKQIIKEALEKYFGKVIDLHKETLDVYEVAEYLNLSVHYIRKLTSKKVIPHRKPTGKKLYFIKSELDEWIFNSRSPKTQDEIEIEASTFLLRKQK